MLLALYKFNQFKSSPYDLRKFILLVSEWQVNISTRAVVKYPVVKYTQSSEKTDPYGDHPQDGPERMHMLSGEIRSKEI